MLRFRCVRDCRGRQFMSSACVVHHARDCADFFICKTSLMSSSSTASSNQALHQYDHRIHRSRRERLRLTDLDGSLQAETQRFLRNVANPSPCLLIHSSSSSTPHATIASTSCSSSVAPSAPPKSSSVNVSTELKTNASSPAPEAPVIMVVDAAAADAAAAAGGGAAACDSSVAGSADKSTASDNSAAADNGRAAALANAASEMDKTAAHFGVCHTELISLVHGSRPTPISAISTSTTSQVATTAPASSKKSKSSPSTTTVAKPKPPPFYASQDEFFLQTSSSPTEVIRVATRYANQWPRSKVGKVTAFARKRAQQGNVYIGKMEYFKALAEFEQALEASPNVPDILLGYSQVLLFLNRHEDAIRCSEIFLPNAPTAAQPYLIRGVSLHFLERQVEAITCLVIGMHLLSLSEENPNCRTQFELYLGKANQALAASDAVATRDSPLPTGPVFEIKEKGGKVVKQEAVSAPSPAPAITGSFDEDADARGFMRPVEAGTSRAAAALQISLHGVDPADLELKNFLEQSLKLAASALAAKKFNLALSIYRQVLDAVPKQNDALRGVIQINEYHERWQICLDTYDVLLADVLQHDPDSASFDFVGLARVCVKLKKPDEAAKSIEKARDHHPRWKQCDPALLAEIQVLHIKTLLLKGEKEEALSLVISSLQKDENSIALLMIYAELCMLREQLGEAVKVYLRCLVIDSANVTVRRALSQTIQRPNGVTIAMQELSEAANSGPALAFMATLVKDYSAIDQSLGLYKRAVDVCPNNPSYSLNLIHTYELCYQYQQAFDEIRRFCRTNPDCGVGALKCSTVLRILEPIVDVFAWKHRGDSSNPQLKRRIIWRPNRPAAVVEADADIDAVRKLQIAPAHLPPSPASAATGREKIPPWTPDQLDTVAIFFTAAKICLVTGCLAPLPQLVELIEPVRTGWDLHLTSIRNEQAYYCCVAQLMEFVHVPLPREMPHIYMCGDSHSMSSAWHTITVKSQRRLLVPKLVTGLKCFHLRPESDFFPKYNFKCVVDTIPDGADVVFMFGEIDCRDGIIRGVERAAYKDLEEGIAATVAIYLNVLEDLARRRNFNIYVQPVAPVLNETRSTVTAFNNMLREMTDRRPPLVFLHGVYEELLTPSGELKKEFELDGTHM